MRQKQTFKLSAGYLALLLAGWLAVAFMLLVPRAGAVADTCTWTGDGTSTVDSTAKTISYDMSDTANWNCSVDGTAAPEDGDALEFPANQAIVDPSDSLSDDIDWKYLVENDISAGINFTSITFTGARGTDYLTVLDDNYFITGLGISLSGDVLDSMTGSRSGDGNVIGADTTFTADAIVEVSIQDLDSLSSYVDVTYGSNTINLCDVSDTARSSRSIFLNVKLIGTGPIVLSCGYGSVNVDPASTFGDVTIESNSLIYGDATYLGSSASRTFTFKDNATFSFLKGNSTGAIEFKSNLVFEGTGDTEYYCTTSDNTKCVDGQPTFIAVDTYRGRFTNSSYNSSTKAYTFYDVTISGSITTATDISYSTFAKSLKLTGNLVGNYEHKLLNGSTGSLVIQSSNNASKTPNGTVTPEKIKYTLASNNGGNTYIYSGHEGLLSSDFEVTDEVTVYDGAVLKGIGKVAGLIVMSGGTLAPGNSPGCITSNGDLVLNGNYDVELAGTTACSGHDQTDVTGAVNVTGATLNLSMLNGYVPKLNDTFTIIKNDGSDAVTGTFSGRADNSRFDVSGVTYEINYDGGDGNDVVLSAVSVPTTASTPDTGVGSIIAQPVAAIASVFMMGGMFVVSRKMNR